MSKNFSKTDTQKQAVAAATRALSSRKIREISYAAAQPSFSQKETNTSYQLNALWKDNNLEDNRGLQDSAALYARFHRESSAPVFKTDEQTTLYHNLMRTRCEALGIRQWGGIGHNIAALYHNTDTDEADDTVTHVTTWARRHLCGIVLPFSVPDIVPNDQWQNLQSSLENQLEYSQHVINIVNDLFDVVKQNNKEKELSGTADKTPDTADKSSADNDQTDEQPAPDSNTSQTTQTDEITAQSEDETKDKADSESLSEPLPVPTYARQDIEYQNTLAHYRIFTRRFDEIVSADKLAEPFELKRLRATLDKHTTDMRKTIARLSNRLGRKLLSQQRQYWQFNQEEGYLDTARLFRLVTDPLRGLAFKRETDNPFKNTIVTILIDNSGSMRGRPIMTAACTADILSQALENTGIKTEILGFTTRAWKGGSARKEWEKMGSPHGVGRLNDIRHIIYKPADTPTRRVRNNLALMLKEGMLKENIDGEALLWAHDRLMRRNENRRILMVISDGAPVDDATLGANGSDYLETHLHQAIHWIENRKTVDLVAIGIGHDVTRYYKNAILLKDVSELGEGLTQKLEELFTPSLSS